MSRTPAARARRSSLQRRPSADLGEPGRDDAHRPHAEGAVLVHHTGHRRCGHGHQRQVRPRGAGGQLRVAGHPPDDLVTGGDWVHRSGEPAVEQVSHQQLSDAAGLVARPHQGDRPGAQERPDRDAGRGALVGQHRVQVGIGFLYGEAGVHGGRRDLLGVFQAQLGEQAPHRHIALGQVAGQPPHPGVPGGFWRAGAAARCPAPRAARRRRRTAGTRPCPRPCAHTAPRPPPTRPEWSRRSPPRDPAAAEPRHRRARTADEQGR